MKHAAFLLLWVCLALGCTATVHAQTLTDHMTGSTGISGAIYQNLAQAPKGYRQTSGWLDAPDDSVMSMASTKQAAVASYCISGVEYVEVDIYSRYGTFACGDLSSPELLTFGVASADSLNQPKTALVLDEHRNVFAQKNELGYQMLLNPKASSFQFVAARPTGETIPYGLAIRSSSSGEAFSTLPMTRVLVAANDLSTGGRVLGCFERYRAVVPGAARYISIVLNDFHEAESTAGGRISLATGNSLYLAKVTVIGAGLTVGLPQASSSATPSQPSSSKSASKASSKQESSKSSKSSSQKTDSQQKREASSSQSSRQEQHSSTPASVRTDDAFVPAEQAAEAAASFTETVTVPSMSPAKIAGAVLFTIGAGILAWKIILNFFIKTT